MYYIVLSLAEQSGRVCMLHYLALLAATFSLVTRATVSDDNLQSDGLVSSPSMANIRRKLARFDDDLRGCVTHLPERLTSVGNGRVAIWADTHWPSGSLTLLSMLDGQGLPIAT